MILVNRTGFTKIVRFLFDFQFNPASGPQALSPVLPPDYVSILHQPRINCSSITKCIQTDLTSHAIQEFECQASSDLELRNNKIDELNRVR